MYVYIYIEKERERQNRMAERWTGKEGDARGRGEGNKRANGRDGPV